jgi:trans-2,3-dihydro-3-hydroxyanthranilate isomerase
MPVLQMLQVDVFTDTPLEGNALAVFPDARGLSTAQMQAIAREMNLSETTFVLPPEDGASDARVRIFTPQSELPFAGHPTIGTAFVLSERAGGSARIRLHENAGIIDVRRESDGRFFMQAPQPSVHATIERGRRAQVAQALGVDAEALVPHVEIQAAGAAGMGFLYVALSDAQRVDEVQFDAAAMLRAAGEWGRQVFVYAPHGENRVYSRMFAPALGVPEDPATGSASGPLTMLLRNANVIAGADPIEAVSEQGTKMGRRSIICLRSHADGRIEVGGRAVKVMTAELTI